MEYNKVFEEGYVQAHKELSWRRNCGDTPVPEVKPDTMLLVAWTDKRGWNFTGHAHDFIDGLYAAMGASKCKTVIVNRVYLRKSDIIYWLEVRLWNEHDAQLCALCKAPTGHSEDESRYCCFCEIGPLCDECAGLDHSTGDCICPECAERKNGWQNETKKL